MNRMLFTLDDFKVDLLADTTWPARPTFLSLAALGGTTQRMFLALDESDGYLIYYKSKFFPNIRFSLTTKPNSIFKLDVTELSVCLSVAIVKIKSLTTYSYNRFLLNCSNWRWIVSCINTYWTNSGGG